MVTRFLSLIFFAFVFGINAQIYVRKDNCTWKLFNVTTVENNDRPGYLGILSATPEAETNSDGSVDTVKDMENHRNAQYVSEFNTKFGDFSRSLLVETFVSNPFDEEVRTRQMFVVDSGAEQFYIRGNMVEALQLAAVGSCTTFTADNTTDASSLYAIQLQFGLRGAGGVVTKTSAMNVTACFDPKVDRNTLSRRVFEMLLSASAATS